jgi:uracil-DNA glycosylase family 4
MSSELDDLESEIVRCRRCPRLVAWREEVARTKRAAFAGETYWGRPVPGFGDPEARVVVLGLAPAAHGGNRTGRIFTGDRSGDWLFRALFHAGFANQPTSTHRGDGLRLDDCFVTAAVRCAPPGNRPTPKERDNCRPWLEAELRLLDRARVIVCLGSFAWSVQTPRLLSSEPAEHLHGEADRSHAGRGVRRGRAARRAAAVAPVSPASA